MTFEKNSFDYHMNMEAFREMDELIPMTRSERDALRIWVKNGHDIETNPWNLSDSDGWPLNYLQAHRIKNGYSSGPWDDWKGSDHQTLWYPSKKSIILLEDYN